MRPRPSVVLACGLVAATLASAASAKTQLFVSGPPETAASGTTVLQVRSAPQDAAWARVTTFVPTGYTINLGQPNGTRIGSASAQVQLRDAGTTAAATGVVLVADPNDAIVQQSATQCTGLPAHAAVWIVRLTASTQTLDVHVYIDPTTGTDARFGSARLVLCLPQPYSKALPRLRTARIEDHRPEDDAERRRVHESAVRRAVTSGAPWSRRGRPEAQCATSLQRSRRRASSACRRRCR